MSAVANERTVRRRVTNVGEAATLQPVVSPPPGVGVSVSPASLSLGAGETTEFTVTFTNLGDPRAARFVERRLAHLGQRRAPGAKPRSW